ncbi:MAG: tRNA (adenosine(37)-N6)-threonylcarbamoyltransferase complex transferase subunit TsaD [Thermomicrobiales bacterium]
MNILGIETSCDETAAAIVTGGQRVRSNVVSSQIDQHRAYGGVVPELAARGHITAIIPVVQAALAEAGMSRSQIDAIAVTEGPGLAGSLLVGVNVAKTLSYAWDRPLVAVNHLESHLYANWLGLPNETPPPAPRFPVLCLLVSGGHTELILMSGHGQYRHLGRTLDDAAGEAFDKAARLLGLGYPGGPAIQNAARGGDPTAFTLPRALASDSPDFSYSGLKTALLHATTPWRIEQPRDAAPLPPGAFREHQPPRFREGLPVADLAASFQQAVVDPLVIRTVRAARERGANTVLLAGGVSANERQREALGEAIAAEFGGETRFCTPEFCYCTDNAAMVAGAAWFVLRRGGQAGWEADVHPRLALV